MGCVGCASVLLLVVVVTFIIGIVNEGPVTRGGAEEPLGSGAVTGCDFTLADDPVDMASVAVESVNLWETADGGGVVGAARGIDGSEPRGTPAWCVGEIVSILGRTTDANGRRRVLVRTADGQEGWVTDFFVMDPNNP